MSLEEAPHISQSERSFSGRTRRLLDGPFSTTVIRFLSKVCALRPEVWKCDRHKPRYGDWRALAWALTISSIGILVRSGNHVLAFLRFPSLPRYRRGGFIRTNAEQSVSQPKRSRIYLSPEHPPTLSRMVDGICPASLVSMFY
ncbi:hypothetical protein M404DRAFT_692799 [Pisolithus tinctorius Marx 270]|uniref:Uncharacterized protein n=1 Tax=Pisolithus tinctorius Marx 270 TaxID=870435 RepID=A0A0C3KTB2_PISTI|nr:hypothetical protein M404DRAFT_692799 [Pisolithus tinctorius Marx 270]